jgi:colanic acid/amylovoran biosynthesis glycosyltransferase
MTAPVLYVLKRFPRLSETFVLRELLALEARGERVLIDSLLPPEQGPRHPELAQLRAPVRQLPRHPRLRDPQVARAHLRIAARVPGRWLTMALRSRSDPEAWRRFLQAGLAAVRIRDEGVRHVHAHFATAAAVVARDAGALTAVPVTVTAHAKDVFHQDNAPLLPSRLRGVRAVVTVTEHNAVHLRRVLPGTPVHVVRNGVHLAAARAGSEPGPAPLLCVSRLVPKKGIDCLLSAVALLARQRPDLCLEVIGTGPLDAALRRQAEELGIAERVDFRGPLPSTDVMEALNRCAMLVLPCRIDESGDRDGLPTVLLEALACATPVVTTDILGLPELVRNGETGVLVTPDDPPGLAAAIARLLEDPVHAAALGAAGRRLVAQLHDCDESAARLQDVWAGAAR